MKKTTILIFILYLFSYCLSKERFLASEQENFNLDNDGIKTFIVGIFKGLDKYKNNKCAKIIENNFDEIREIIITFSKENEVNDVIKGIMTLIGELYSIPNLINHCNFVKLIDVAKLFMSKEGANEILINVSDNINDLLNNFNELITSFGEGDFENSGYNLGMIIKIILGFYVY